ncbi:MAG: glycosyltransferase family 39 protein [Candidatus Goldbacteria bacterium]|nr:glycosyltransferase family 39 protein [Candidatus Goldiibacteriota bacterium]
MSIILMSHKDLIEDKFEQNKKILIFDFLYCVFVFIISVIIFSWKLLDIPPGVHGDETLTVKMARRLASGEIFPVILAEDAYNGMGIFFYWLIGMSGKIFGQNLINARMLSIIVGASGVVFVYLLIKEIFSRRLAILSTIFLSTFFMQIFYSRMAMQWIWVPALATAAYYFFFKGLKNGRPLFFILTGLILSVNLGLYSAAKVSPFPVIIFILFMYIFTKTRQYIISNFPGILLMLLALLLTFLPIIDYMIHFPQYYFKRMGHVGLLKHFPVNYEEWQVLITNILKNIQMFFTESAIGYCHNLPTKPFLDEYSALLVIIGIGYLLVTWKKQNSLFIILWLFFGLLPGFLSRLGPEDPYPARTVLAIPAMIITLSLGLETILRAFENINKKIFKFITPLIALYFFIIFSFYNLRNYFILFPKDPHTLSYYRHVDKLNFDYIMKNKSNYLFILSKFFHWNYYFDVFEDFYPPQFNKYIFVEDVSLFELYKIYNYLHKNVSISGEGIYYRMFPIYREYFPNAEIDIIWDTNFWQFDKNSDLKYCYEWKYPDKTIDLNIEFEWFYVYDPMVRFVKIVRAEIPAEDIKNTFCLKGEFYKNNIKIKEENIKLPLNLENNEFDKIVINGLVDIPVYGEYEFISDVNNWKLNIDGLAVNKKIELYKGLHRIKIIIDKNNKQSFNLKWKNNKMESFENISEKFFINSDKIFGLLAVYKVNGNIIYKELQPMVNYRLYHQRARPADQIADPKEHEIEWSGYININQDDIYEFKLHNLNDAKIFIDEKVVFIKEESQEKIIPVRLTKGKKKIKIIRFNKYKNYDWHLAHAIRFMYRKSEWKEYAPVPYNLLFPY